MSANEAPEEIWTYKTDDTGEVGSWYSRGTPTDYDVRYIRADIADKKREAAAELIYARDKRIAELDERILGLLEKNTIHKERVAELEADNAALGVESTHARIALKNAVKDLNRVDPSIKRYEGTYLAPLET